MTMLSATVNNLRGKTRNLLRRREPGAVVMLYHRVAALSGDPQLLAVSPDRFDEHMRLIARDYQPISLSWLASCMRRGDVPERSVVVTFDDGYADNLTYALPILAKHGVPATVFVATGNLDRASGFYWDKLEDIFLTGRDLPERMAIAHEGETIAYAIEPSGLGDGDDWNALAEPVTRRQRVYLALCDKLRPMPPAAQRSVMGELCAWAGVSPEARPTHRVMTGAQLRELAASPLIEVGAHTIDHPILATLPREEQHRQITQSKATLEAVTGRPIVSLSYPYGTRSSYTDETTALVAGAGFDCGCSNFPGSVGRSADPYQIPRVLIRDWSGDRVMQELKGAAA